MEEHLRIGILLLSLPLGYPLNSNCILLKNFNVSKMKKATGCN